MFVKVDNEIYDSAEEIITIQLDAALKAHIAKMGPNDDLLTIAPKGTESKDINKFNKIFQAAGRLAPVEFEPTPGEEPLQMPPKDINELASGQIPDSLMPGE